MKERPEALADSPVVVSGEAVRKLVLNRPGALNALDGLLHAAVADAIAKVARDPDVRAVLLTGSGRAFSAGGDMGLIRAMRSDRRLREETLDTSRKLFERLSALEVPTIAAVNGPAVGAGCTLALLCDVVVMADDAHLADPHVNLGLVPGDGGAVLWPLLAGLPAARAYLFTGDRVSATEAHRLGLAHRVVPADELLAVAGDLAERIASRPSFAIRETKRALNLHLAQAQALAFDTALRAEYRSFDSVEHLQLTGDMASPESDSAV